MIILEKLYESAAARLTSGAPDWAGFAEDFRTIFNAHMILYRPQFEADNVTMHTLGTIVTSDPEMEAEYVRQKLYVNHPVPEQNLTPLEPLRRNETISDEMFRQIGARYDFFETFGMFHMMIVPAKLPDGDNLALMVWRPEDAENFSDIEKQRAALFMRYLLSLIGAVRHQSSEMDNQVAAFGARYNLTDAETEVLAALLSGEPLRQIAAGSGRSYGTVRWHVQNILEKCQVSNQKNLLREFYSLIRA